MHAESEQKRIESGDTRPDATGSSSSISSAIARGSQLVTAPVRSIANYLWPSSSPSGGAATAQAHILSLIHISEPTRPY